MSLEFYKTIIEDEIKAFGIKEESLKVGAVSVSKTYSRRSLTKGQTFLDYNLPSNRCAYIFKFATIHTKLVTKYFRKLVGKKEIKSVFRNKKELKICCLGGGPGTDIVGLFKALAVFPYFHKRVVEVTVLDVCGGWRNSFKRVISSLIDGKVKDVPESFIDILNFKFNLIEVNLLHDLPANIVTILSEADIICMVKFVSAILGSPASLSALKVIGDILKVGAVVFFIDNFQGNVFQPLVDISDEIGLQMTMGPLHVGFNKKTGYMQGPVTSKEIKMFGCMPVCNTRVTILGFIKSNKKCKNFLNSLTNVPSEQLINKDGDDSWDTDNESENFVRESKMSFPQFVPQKKYLNKFTQTEEKYLKKSYASENNCAEAILNNELSSLVSNLCSLVTVLSQYKEQIITNRCYHRH